MAANWTKKQRQEYNRQRKAARRNNPHPSDVSGYVEFRDRSDFKIEPSQFNFKGADEDEPTVCSSFGCAKHLTNEERLYGNKCINCQDKKKNQPTQFIQY